MVVAVSLWLLVLPIASVVQPTLAPYLLKGIQQALKVASPCFLQVTRVILKVVTLPLQVAYQCKLMVMSIILRVCVRLSLSLVYVGWYSSLMNALNKMCLFNVMFALMLLVPLMPAVLLLPGTPLVALRVLRTFVLGIWSDTVIADALEEALGVIKKCSAMGDSATQTQMEAEITALRKSITERKPAVTRHTATGRGLARAQQRPSKMQEDMVVQGKAVKETQDRRRGGSPEPADARRRGAEEERPAPTAPTAEAGAAGASAAAAAAGEAGPATAAAADGEPQGSPAAASAEGIGQTLSATVPGTALAVVDAPQAPAAAAFAPAGGKPLSITEVVRAGMQPPGGSSLILNLMRRAQAQKEPAPAPPGIGLRPPAKDFGAGLTPREKSDLKEEEFKLNREMNPEPSRDVMPLQLLKDRCPTPFGWVTCVSDDANRSWMYLADKKQDIHVSDLQTLLSGVKWINVAGSPGGAVTRKTMWWVKEGCKCPYNYGTHRVEAEPFPDWFKDMSKRWLSCLNLNDDTDRDSRFPDSVNLNLYENGSHIVAWHSDDEPISNPL
ncbi:unnamed protein product [Prorocentrum cordatum]|uniref:Alpha-ketoglutarate-dependent dioxygenase AlkB-like domain-containing protein n=1 Tax=Prorocentrum cordatum TaxID=2364126 RepID=A0ABN9W0H6_9DINO|nr:unnamed protein product [Polarella glacialis]